MHVSRIDWAGLEASLDTHGHARLPGLLTARECRGLAQLSADPKRFRKQVDRGKQRFGEGGDYQYFSRPLPALVSRLRRSLYPGLARIANHWQRRLGSAQRFPSSLRPFLSECHAAGQERPTPLLLRYRAGGYNRLHQDLYGPVAFPLQVAVLLSNPATDFTGGEFLLVEQRARMQSRGDAIALRRGEAVVFPTRERPIAGARGTTRAQVRHGTSRLLSGNRLVLGIIFHDAK
ncbi:MAG: 2OG-Fe(II) oxygenase [Myxococcota bacterium]|nr:2OG-Fe(II) oxygenase [Myxococcota bacterium]